MPYRDPEKEKQRERRRRRDRVAYQRSYYLANRERLLAASLERERQAFTTGMISRPTKVKIHANGRLEDNPLPPRRGRPKKKR